jgi:hypothetical protein
VPRGRTKEGAALGQATSLGVPAGSNASVRIEVSGGHPPTVSLTLMDARLASRRCSHAPRGMIPPLQVPKDRAAGNERRLAWLLYMSLLAGSIAYGASLVSLALEKRASGDVAASIR